MSAERDATKAAIYAALDALMLSIVRHDLAHPEDRITIAPQTEAWMTLQRAAGIWGLSNEAARKRALQIEPRGLAKRLRPGGWRISTQAFEDTSRQPGWRR